jgi:hypothetical protein
MNYATEILKAGHDALPSPVTCVILKANHSLSYAVLEQEPGLCSCDALLGVCPLSIAEHQLA